MVGFKFWLIAATLLAFIVLRCCAAKSEVVETLRELYLAVESEDPSLNWDINADFCEWDGIKCEHGQIIELSLDYAHEPIYNEWVTNFRLDYLNTLRVLRLKGFNTPIIFVGLFTLTGLKELNFEKSNFYVDITDPEWTQLSSLETLDLRTADFQQPLGAWIYCHSSLTTLRIKIDSFSDTEVHQRCHNSVLQRAYIELLVFSASDISDNFSNLRELRIKCLYSPPSFNKLYLPTTLEILESDHCKLGQISINGSAALKELSLLSMGYRSWDDIDTLLNALIPQLELIDLSRNRIGGKLLDLTQFPRLQHFNVSGNQIADQVPSYVLPNLATLDLSNNNLNGSIPTTICLYSALEQLLLLSNSLSGPIPNCLGRSQSNLRVVMLHTNYLTGSIPHTLLQHSMLHTLNLAHNKLQGTLPLVLSNQISILDLSFNSFTGHLSGSMFTNLTLISLNLANNQLEGDIPEELFTMPKLQRLNLSANRISGTLPLALSQNNILTHIDLSENQLTGSIPTLICPCEKLYLNNNEFTGPIEQEFDDTLEILDIRTNKISLVDIYAPQLLEFYASDNEITSFALGTPKLQVLDFANNRISDIKQLFALTSLVKFDISRNSIVVPLRIQSSRFPELRYYNLSGNGIPGIYLDLDYEAWPIETIDFSHNKLDIGFPFTMHTGFGNSLRHLRYLYLNDNHIYGHISEMDTTLISRLHGLNIANNQMHGELNSLLLASISKSNLVSLIFSGNRDVVIDSEDLQILMSHPNIQQLSLSYCSVEGFSDAFPALNRLEVLELAGCGLRGEIFTAAINKLRLLRRLDLSSNEFTVMPSPDVWEWMVGLEYLDLSGNPNLEGELPKELSQSGLRYIDVSNTKVSGSLPLIRSNVIEVARFANCSFTGVVERFSIKKPMLDFDISNNQLRYFHDSWQSFDCLNSSVKQPFAKKCNMFGNDFQCYRFPEWTINCCDAVCYKTEEVLFAASGSISSGILLVVVIATTLYYGRRYLLKRKNVKSLEHLERSLLADAFDNVEHDMMIAWSDIKFTAKIGEGAAGVVYRGIYKGIDVAVKTFKVAPSATIANILGSSDTKSNNSNQGTTMNDEYKETLQELITEVRFLMKLKHPYIVMLMGASVDRGRLAIVLEFMQNGSLHNILHKAKQPLDWKTKIRIAHQIACGMQYLHLQTPPVIHRDLKSMNILVDSNLTAKITDFGFSRENGASAMTSMVGTIAYMAPEMFGYTDGETNKTTRAIYDTTCDVYSFGILLWELLTEQIPWHNCIQPMLIASVLRGDRPELPSTEMLLHKIQASSEQQQYETERAIELEERTLLRFDGNAKEKTNNYSTVTAYIDLMKRCWAQNQAERPNFSTIAKDLNELTRCT